MAMQRVEPYDDPDDLEEQPPQPQEQSTGVAPNVNTQLKAIEQELHILNSKFEMLEDTTEHTHKNAREIQQVQRQMDNLQMQVDSLRNESLKHPATPKEKPWWAKRGQEH
jgi:hypothetical protein